MPAQTIVACAGGFHSLVRIHSPHGASCRPAQLRSTACLSMHGGMAVDSGTLRGFNCRMHWGQHLALCTVSGLRVHGFDLLPLWGGCHARSPVKKMFRFQSGDADSPVAGAPLESPYVVSPVGRDAPLGSPLASPKRAQRKISRSPFKVPCCAGTRSCDVAVASGVWWAQPGWLRHCRVQLPGSCLRAEGAGL